MTEYLTEQEQIEILKNWIKQYSAVILTGVLIAAIAIFGWRYWQQRQNKILSHASALYDVMLNKRAQNDGNGTATEAQKIIDRFPSTAYAQMAAFALAREAVNKNNYAEAGKQLNWILDNSSVPSIRQIARIRLARVLIADQKPEQAIKVLKKIEDKNFNGLSNEVIGDAYLAMKEPATARQFYQQALSQLPNADVMRPLLQMKYDNLATIQ